MIFHITIKREDITVLRSKNAKVTFIPFNGTVDSPLFKGTVRPGAADVQVTNAAGIRHMNANYIFEGVDQNNEPCHLYVNNHGYFEPDHNPDPFHACPTFISDSIVLNDYLSSPHFRAEGHGTSNGVDILIYDTNM